MLCRRGQKALSLAVSKIRSPPSPIKKRRVGGNLPFSLLACCGNRAYKARMCTNFAHIRNDSSRALAAWLDVSTQGLIYSRDFRPGSTISIVTGGSGYRGVKAATWWLYLQQTNQGLKPHRDYFSVNTNYRKLPEKPEFRTHRCIIPATAFVESQDGKRPHLLEPADGSAIAFGGLWKEWTDRATGEIVYSASIITLPGHPALENIHRKSMPLWLPRDRHDQWLDPEMTDTGQLYDLLSPTLQADLKATPIDRAGSKVPIGQSFTISHG